MSAADTRGMDDAAPDNNNPPRGGEYDPLDGMGALVVPTVIAVVVAVIGAIASISALARWVAG